MGRMKEYQLRQWGYYGDPAGGGGSVEEVAEQLKGEVTGDREVLAPVPGGGSMTVRINRDRWLFIYAVDGCSWAAAKSAIADIEPEPDPLAGIEKHRRA